MTTFNQGCWLLQAAWCCKSHRNPRIILCFCCAERDDRVRKMKELYSVPTRWHATLLTLAHVSLCSVVSDATLYFSTFEWSSMCRKAWKDHLVRELSTQPGRQCSRGRVRLVISAFHPSACRPSIRSLYKAPQCVTDSSPLILKVKTLNSENLACDELHWYKRYNRISYKNTHIHTLLFQASTICTTNQIICI